MQGVDICMSVKYNIELPNEISADFWELINNNFNVILLKKQHSVDGDTLNVKLKIIERKQ